MEVRALKEFFTATGGEKWRHKNGWASGAISKWLSRRGWMSALPLCEWEGVTVDNTGQLVKLFLYDNNLSGITHLTDLKV